MENSLCHSNGNPVTNTVAAANDAEDAAAFSSSLSSLLRLLLLECLECLFAFVGARTAGEEKTRAGTFSPEAHPHHHHHHLNLFFSSSSSSFLFRRKHY